MESLPYVLDLAGTFVFALSGAMAGVKHKLDLFGVLVLSFVAANTGGIIRDILIGAVPPAAINDWHYVGVSLVAGLVTFYFPSAIVQRWNPVLLFDAAGLGPVRGLWGAQGSCVWTEPGHGHFAWHVDGNWRRHGARCSVGRDPHRVAFRPLCCRGPGWSGDRRDRKHAAASVRSSGACRSGALLRAPRPRDQAGWQLPVAGRTGNVPRDLDKPGEP